MTPQSQDCILIAWRGRPSPTAPKERKDSNGSSSILTGKPYSCSQSDRHLDWQLHPDSWNWGGVPPETEERRKESMMGKLCTDQCLLSQRNRDLPSMEKRDAHPKNESANECLWFFFKRGNSYFPLPLLSSFSLKVIYHHHRQRQHHSAQSCLYMLAFAVCTSQMPPSYPLTKS